MKQAAYGVLMFLVVLNCILSRRMHKQSGGGKPEIIPRAKNTTPRDGNKPRLHAYEYRAWDDDEMARGEKIRGKTCTTMLDCMVTMSIGNSYIECAEMTEGVRTCQDAYHVGRNDGDRCYYENGKVGCYYDLLPTYKHKRYKGECVCVSKTKLDIIEAGEEDYS
ncbi:MAG: hypothetical protein MJ252_27215 [archaeon]|nr:hypothetical protein [archaeon]